jgi:hypothetical protein
MLASDLMSLPVFEIENGLRPGRGIAVASKPKPLKSVP